jgi:hypothetical protein
MLLTFLEYKDLGMMVQFVVRLQFLLTLFPIRCIKQIDILKISHASCVIRKRLSPNDEEDNMKSINQIWDAFKTHCAIFYSDFANC